MHTTNDQLPTNQSICHSQGKNEEPSQIPTPRTDLACGPYHDYYTDGLVDAEFARGLERENAALFQQAFELSKWKESALTVESWWAKIDAFVRTQPEAMLGKSVAGIALEWLNEWRAYKDGADPIESELAARGWLTISPITQNIRTAKIPLPWPAPLDDFNASMVKVAKGLSMETGRNIEWKQPDIDGATWGSFGFFVIEKKKT